MGDFNGTSCDARVVVMVYTHAEETVGSDSTERRISTLTVPYDRRYGIFLVCLRLVTTGGRHIGERW